MLRTALTARQALRLATGAGLLLAASHLPAFAVPIMDGTTISFDVRGEKVQGYLSQPAVSGFHPGVVVVHEWWGLNEQIQGVADRLAEQGYVVLTPDLYRGKRGTDAGLAHELMRGLNENWAVDVLAAAAGALRDVDATRARRAQGERMPVGLLGFCMGGRLSLATALKGKDVQAAVMFYGSVETDKEALRPLAVPLLGIFGDEDRGIPIDQIRAFEAALKEAGKDATVLVYRGAGHAFFNEDRPSYHKESSTDAWARTKMFLKEKLSAPVRGKRSPPPAPSVPAGD